LLRCTLSGVGALALSFVMSASASAQIQLPTGPNRDAFAYEVAGGMVVAIDSTGVYPFENWAEYYASPFFTKNDMRCGWRQINGIPTKATSDCSSSNTNPAASFDPAGGALYRIPVVVHIIESSTGSGRISDALVASQIQILNEDFKAIAGSLGQNGYNASIEFFLATTDPSGNPTTGITRTVNSTWYNDSGDYWTPLAWDTRNYLNIYTNTAGGNLGYAYVPSGGGVVGNVWDRVVIYWASFGLNGPIGPPYNLGRTVTHEVGHYLGLYHTFQGGCSSTSGCNNNGDLICDTNPEQSPNYSPCTRETCGGPSPDPTDNYMDYSDDICMQRFTVEQVRRMRCTLQNFRIDLPDTGGGGTLPGKAGSPSPANGATNVATSATLAWSAGSTATSYDVYFGTDSTPDSTEFLGNQAGTTFNPGALAAGTTYYWRIDSKNATGTTTGDVWSFTTAGGAATIVLTVTPTKVNNKWVATLNWTGTPMSGGTVQIYRAKNGASLSLLTTTADDGNFVNSTNFKGTGSLTYRVCIPGGACSNTVTVNY
jgi:Pregnancy-associated plasma protein-A